MTKSLYSWNARSHCFANSDSGSKGLFRNEFAIEACRSMSLGFVVVVFSMRVKIPPSRETMFLNSSSEPRKLKTALPDL